MQMKIARERTKRKREVAELIDENLIERPQRDESRPSANRDIGRLSHAGHLQEESAQIPTFWHESPEILTGQSLVRPSPEMRGHTSFLTFASMYPKELRQQISDGEPVEVANHAVLNSGNQLEPDEITEYGSDGIDEALGTMTEEEMIAIAGS